jgi:hypothetical protein
MNNEWIRTGTAQISLDERGLPVIRPIKVRDSASSAAAREDEAKHQVKAVLRIQIYDPVLFYPPGSYFGRIFFRIPDRAYFL